MRNKLQSVGRMRFMHALCDSLINPPPTHTHTQQHRQHVMQITQSVAVRKCSEMGLETPRHEPEKSAIKYNKIKLIIKRQRQQHQPSSSCSAKRARQGGRGSGVCLWLGSYRRAASNRNCIAKTGNNLSCFFSAAFKNLWR